MAGLRHLGCLNSRPSGGGSCSVRCIDRSQRSKLHRQRQLATSQQCSFGSTPTIPGIPAPQSPQPTRAPAHGSFGAALGRGLDGPLEGDRHVPRVEEEAGRKTWRRKQERQGEGGRCSCPSKSQSKSQAGEVREGQKTEGAGRTRGVRHCWLAEDAEHKEEGPKVGGPLAPEDSQPEIRVPGSQASTFSSRAHLQKLFRVLWKGRCRLSGFARSFATFCRRHQDYPSPDSTASQEPFPLPNPYPEILLPGRSHALEDEARKKWVFTVVCVFNYLHLGKPRSFEGFTTSKSRPNRMQWEVISRLEGFLRSWLEVSLVGPQEMGRTAGKVESLEYTLRQLEARAQQLAKPGVSYFGEGSKIDERGDPDLEGGVAFGKVDGGALTTFKSVDPARLSFAGRPVFDPTPFLDPTGQAIFNDPLKCRQKPEEYAGPRPRLRVHASTSNKIRLFELLDASGRLGLHARSEVTQNFGSGMFAITKDLEKDRLILDSRGANLLETPSQRWIRSLASAETLTKIHLPRGKVLRASGNDLRDFYYGFLATPSRSRRNVLVGEVPTRAVQHLHCMKPRLHHEPALCASMATLAMGDCQAVELAHTCHMGLSIQSNILTPATCLAMGLPPPRGDTMVGILIDDFISLSLTPEKEDSQPSKAAALADEMQQAYQDVKLLPNHKKAFRDQEISSFWGADVDGRRGEVRGALRRALPVSALCLEVAKIGYATGDLLQVLVGAVISLFLFRRRLLSILGPLFQAYRGQDPKAIIQLGPKTRETLLMVVVLMPLAATNIRAQPNPWLCASDASGWGEAAVITRVDEKVYLELLRHCLRKSLWVRLLFPVAAWRRAAGLLEAGGEVPEDETPYTSHPLWQTLVEALPFKLLYSNKKSGNRHINIGEVRAALKAERILARRRPSTRIILGLDSQVALGSLIKGRASSPALNRELERSLPHMIAFDSYSEGVYFETKRNRSDAPTRHQPIPGPTEELSSWWKSLAEGRFEEFDQWLKERGLEPWDLAQLPPFEELEGDWRSSKKEERGAGGEVSPEEQRSVIRCSAPEVEKKNEEGAFGTKMGMNALPEDEDRAKKEEEGAEAEKDRRTEAGKRGQRTEAEKRRLRTEEFGCSPRKLNAEQIRCLSSFSRNQFVLPDSMSWPPTEAGWLDLYSGERGVATVLAKEYGCWSLCFDITHSETEDLYDAELRTKIERAIALECFLGGGGGPVCSSFSTAITPPVRSRDWPYGREDVSEAMLEKLQRGNDLALWTFKVLELMLSLSLVVWMENPAMSWMFRLPEWEALMLQYPSLRYWLVDYCRFKAPWRKRTRFATNSCLKDQRCLCQGGHKHQVLRGRSRKHKQNWTLVAQAYPVGVCRSLAASLVLTACEGKQMKLDAAACAHCNLRIGEASHPGPRASHRPRAGALYDVPLVEAKTKQIQVRVWEGFVRWLSASLTPDAVRSAMSCPPLLAQLLEQYGNHLYQQGAALYAYRHLVVVTQQSVAGAKPWLGPCWEMIARWEVKEPPSHRTPLPLTLFRAMFTTAVLWGWRRFACILGISFYGISRPGEPLAEPRKSLLLPSDLLESERTTAFLRISSPKTRRRGGGRVQHLTITETAFVGFLERTLADLSRDAPLFPGAPSTFRRRWDAILEALGVPKSAGLTPGGIRGGGCVAAFHRGLDLSKILWLMRIRHLQTLEAYLQEVAASSVVPDLPSFARRRVKAASALFDLAMSGAATPSIA